MLADFLAYIGSLWHFQEKSANSQLFRKCKIFNVDSVWWMSRIILRQDDGDLGGWSQELLPTVPDLVDLFLYPPV